MTESSRELVLESALIELLSKLGRQDVDVTALLADIRTDLIAQRPGCTAGGSPVFRIAISDELEAAYKKVGSS